MINRYDQEYDSMDIRKKGDYVKVEDMKAELLRITFNSYTVEEYQAALNKLIEELK